MYGNGKEVEKAKSTSTGWLSGAFTWTRSRAKTEVQGVLASHDVTASLPANLSNLPSAPPEDLPNPAPLSLNQMDIRALPERKLEKIDENADEGIEDLEVRTAALSLQPAPIHKATDPGNNLDFSGPLPNLPPLSLPTPTLNQGREAYDQIKGKVRAIPIAWANVVEPAIALKIAHDCKLDAVLAAKKRALDEELKTLTKLLSETNSILRKNRIVLVDYDTPAESGKHIAAQIDDCVDMIRRNLFLSDTGELRVSLPRDCLENLTSHLKNVSDAAFLVISSKLRSERSDRSGRGIEQNHPTPHTGIR